MYIVFVVLLFAYNENARCFFSYTASQAVVYDSPVVTFCRVDLCRARRRLVDTGTVSRRVFLFSYSKNRDSVIRRGRCFRNVFLRARRNPLTDNVATSRPNGFRSLLFLFTVRTPVLCRRRPPLPLLRWTSCCTAFSITECWPRRVCDTNSSGKSPARPSPSWMLATGRQTSQPAHSTLSVTSVSSAERPPSARAMCSLRDFPELQDHSLPDQNESLSLVIKRVKPEVRTTLCTFTIVLFSIFFLKSVSTAVQSSTSIQYLRPSFGSIIIVPPHRPTCHSLLYRVLLIFCSIALIVKIFYWIESLLVFF